jgi:Spy/CpxP family protein refolding chaperone
MKRIAILIPVIAAVLLAPAAAIAQGPPPGPHGRGHGFIEGEGPFFLEHMLPFLEDHLELSDEQIAQIETILDSELPSIKETADELAAAREAYAANSDPAEFNEEAFRAFLESQVPTTIDLRVAVARTRAAVFQVLTSEQQEQLQNMRSQAGKRPSKRGTGRRPS